eukprot:XP_004945024.2 histone-lysine N-methyltransferase 2B-like [Gallus gallus]
MTLQDEMQSVDFRGARPVRALPVPGSTPCPAQRWPPGEGTALIAPRWSPRRHPPDLSPSPMTAIKLRTTCPKQRWPPQPGSGGECLPLPKMAAGGGGRGLCPGSRARGWGGGAPGAEPEVPRCLLQLVVISCGGSVLRRRGSAAAGRGGGRHRLRHRGRKLRPLGGWEGKGRRKGKERKKEKIEAKRGGGGSARRTRRGRARRLSQLLPVPRSPAPSPGAVSRGASPSAAARRQRPPPPARPLYMRGKAARLEPRRRAAREGLRRGTAAAGPRAPVSLPGPSLRGAQRPSPRPVISGRFGRTG